MAFRVIARLDVKPPNLVKGIHLEGFRRLGAPGEFARLYYEAGADEIQYQDIVASLYERNGLSDLVTSTATSVFVPITVGGGLRSVGDAAGMVRAGADKICINTAAIREPLLISNIAASLGSQAVVVGVEAKRISGGWTAMTDCGREHTGRNVVEWVTEVEQRGAGEVLLTSIDREGTMDGFDWDLIEAVRSVTSLPVVVHGGLAEPADGVRAAKLGANGISVASVLHYRKFSIQDLKRALLDNGVEVRT